jgi:hypothetical protein
VASDSLLVILKATAPVEHDANIEPRFVLEREFATKGDLFVEYVGDYSTRDRASQVVDVGGGWHVTSHQQLDFPVGITLQNTWSVQARSSSAMKSMFANLTKDDFGGSSRRARAAASRQRVHALFYEIQLAIHDGNRVKVAYLMAELAEATAQKNRAPVRCD